MDIIFPFFTFFLILAIAAGLWLMFFLREKNNGAGYKKTRIGDYILDSEIGKGGMATIYRAKHIPTRSTVAVKILDNSHISDQQIVEKFKAEGENLTKIKNTYFSSPVVTVYDYGFEKITGQYIIVMEYLRGKNLKKILDTNKRISFKSKLHIIREVARALRDSHRFGIYHSDVSPDNIIVYKNKITLIDFGVAIVRNASQSTPNAIAGKLYYMSPEQCEGGKITGKSDIYSLGATMFHVLQGTPPHFSPNRTKILDPRRFNEIPVIKIQAPQEINNFIYRMLDKCPDNRPDAQEVMDKIQFFINHLF